MHQVLEALLSLMNKPEAQNFDESNSKTRSTDRSISNTIEGKIRNFLISRY